MSEKYYTVQDKINGAFSTVNESDYKPYDPASGGSSFDPSVLEPYAEIENVDASLALKADKTELQNYTPYSEYEQTTDAVSVLQNDMANVYTQAEVDDRINRIPKFNIAVIEELPTTDISTTTVYLKKIGDEAGNMYAEYIYVNDAWEKLGEQSVNLSDYAKISDVDASLNLKADKTSIPTKVSAFTNDVGYLTEHQSLTDYAKKTDIPDTTNFATKNEIPSVKFWTGTQAEYDAIATKDDNTVYFVK